MNRLNILEALFVSIAFAEERIFKKSAGRDLLGKWEGTWTAIAFAEAGITPPGFTRENTSRKLIPQCQLGDISCFLTRNA